MWHSLEHVFSYKDTLSLISEILISKGNLIIACPNYESFDANYYKKFWAGFDVPRHYWHFSPNGLIEIMSQNGFDHIKKKPPVFTFKFEFLTAIKSPKFFCIFCKTISTMLRFTAGKVTDN